MNKKNPLPKRVPDQSLMGGYIHLWTEGSEFIAAVNLKDGGCIYTKSNIPDWKNKDTLLRMTLDHDYLREAIHTLMKAVMEKYGTKEVKTYDN